MKKLCIVILVTTSMCSFVPAATTIDGSMEVVFGAASPPTTRHFTFSCIVQRNGWRIVTRQDQNETTGHRERAKDGTNVFRVHYVTPPVTTNNLVILAQGKFARDDENVIPYFTEDFTHVLWLSYCRQLKSSSQFYDSTISSRMLYGDNMPPTNFPCSASWNSSDPLALEKLDISHPGVVFGMKGEGYPLSGGLAEGYIAGQFEAAGFTNVGNGLFPQSASWSFFSARRAGAEQLETFHHVKVWATSISSVPDEADIRPKVSVLMSVDDYRFAALAGKGSTYLTTNGWWSPEEKRFTDYAGIIKWMKDQQKLVPVNRKLAILAFVVMILVPGLFLFLRSKKGSLTNANPSY